MYWHARCGTAPYWVLWQTLRHLRRQLDDFGFGFFGVPGLLEFTHKLSRQSNCVSTGHSLSLPLLLALASASSVMRKCIHGMIAGSSIIPARIYKIQGVLECAYRSPDRMLQMWLLQLKRLSQQPRGNSALRPRLHDLRYSH